MVWEHCQILARFHRRRWNHSSTTDHQKYGSGATRREKVIQREIARARERGELSYADDEAIAAKRKHDDLADPRVRLADDGELSASFAEDMVIFEEESKRMASLISMMKESVKQ